MRAAGDLLGRRYRLADRIASGGMGEVWKATDEVLGRTVAVKVLHPRMFADPGFGARFRTEARVMAALRHPGVVDVYDYGENGGEGGTPIAYLVMAYVDSEPLSERISAAGTLEAAETMAIVAQTARALRAAHSAGVVHRDVKPGNLLIRPDGHVVLVDFGVARSSDATSAALTGVNEVVGTALYMAPEQVAKRPITPATDIYALGAVAYHCLAGEPPFPGDNALTVAMRHLDEDPPALPDEVPEAVRALIIRAMAKEPEERFPTAAAMAEAAERAGGGKVGRRAAGLAPLAGPTSTLARPTTTLPRPAAAAVPAGATALTEGSPDEDERTGRFGGPGWSSWQNWPERRVAAIAGVLLLALASVAAVLAFANPLGGSDPEGGRTPAPDPASEAPAPATSPSFSGQSPGTSISPFRSPGRGINPFPGGTLRPTGGPGQPTGGPVLPPTNPPPVTNEPTTGPTSEPTDPPPTTDPEPTDEPTVPPVAPVVDEG
jgi:eukaryotic-like serine/threonine-protein kinase